MVNVALDAMGGDNAPVQIVQGALDALWDNQELTVHLVGKEEEINPLLEGAGDLKDRLRVLDAREVIEMAEPPVMAIRRKKDSSIVKALKLVKDGECDAFVSSGSTGAILVGAQLIVGRIRGIERPPLAPLLPTAKTPVLLIDCGANVDARSSHLVQFARMGTIYMESVQGVKVPKVGIVNIGAEEEKGNALVRETFPLLKECQDINFVGSVEARDIPAGAVDIAVCEAFVGNVILKTYEGVGMTLLDAMKEALTSSLTTKIGALMIKSSLKATLKKFDAHAYGGAPMLGLNGLVMKTHGSAKAGEIKNTMLQAVQFVQADVNGKIKEQLIEG
ncbi:MAG: phosphate acyltransferase PlsX [Lachnospiraceae bacterium]|nr:phosphate acyltransferase PlsX [Lachnospiraceae bacterium]